MPCHSESLETYVRFYLPIIEAYYRSLLSQPGRFLKHCEAVFKKLLSKNSYQWRDILNTTINFPFPNEEQEFHH
jgi:hypothetical protein